MGIALIALALAAPARPVRQTFAEEGPGSLSAILETFAVFEYGSDDTALHALRSLVRSGRSDPEFLAACETAFIAFLEGRATLAGKQVICRELALIGTERSVPVLERMLAAEGTSDMARYGLEGIPGPASDKALLRGLSVLRGDPRIGVVSSLGNKRCAAAVPALEGLLRSSDVRESGAAAEALGRIGGPAATLALSAFIPKAPASVRERAGAGLLACAEGLLARGDARDAAAAFGLISDSVPIPALRQAAFRGTIAASGPEGRGLILSALRGRPSGMVQPAIDMTRVAFNGDSISQACELLPGLPEEGQVQLVAVLASFPKASVLEALKTASDSPLPAVRVEALRALGKAGDGSVVLLFAERAANATGREQETARESLRRLGETDVDRAVLDAIASDISEAVRLELVRAVGERGLVGGKDILLNLARSAPHATRLQAIRALGRLARADDDLSLLDLLSAATDEAEIEEIGNVIASTAREYAPPNERAGAVESRLASEKSPENRAALLRVLGRIGEDRSLPIVRETLADADPRVADAAARAVAGWPTVLARDDALRIARSSAVLVHRVLALEGFIRMVGLEPFRAPEGAVASLREALALAERPEERRLVVSALVSFACPEALALAEELSRSPDIGSEARAAAEAIRAELASRRR